MFHFTSTFDSKFQSTHYGTNDLFFTMLKVKHIQLPKNKKLNTFMQLYKTHENSHRQKMEGQGFVGRSWISLCRRPLATLLLSQWFKGSSLTLSISCRAFGILVNFVIIGIRATTVWKGLLILEWKPQKDERGYLSSAMKCYDWFRRPKWVQQLIGPPWTSTKHSLGRVNSSIFWRSKIQFRYTISDFSFALKWV